MLKDLIEGVYTVRRPDPAQAVPMVFDSPHSGRTYPPEFDFGCPVDALRRAEDNEVDLLLDSVPAHGGTLLCAEFPRTFIDVNRREDDWDPELLSAPPPAHVQPGRRSSAGIGLVRRLVRPGMPVYNRRLRIREVSQRIEKYYKPYHHALNVLLEEAHYNYGIAWHVNCHSMPSANGGASDFVLGDRDGTSCDLAFTHALRDFLKKQGYRVAINNPYKGVELVRRHGKPRAGYHSLQLEINKALYWNENQNKRNRNYSNLKSDMEKLVAFCAEYATGSLTAIAAD